MTQPEQEDRLHSSLTRGGRTLSTEEAEDARGSCGRTDESVWLRLGDGRTVIVRDGLLALERGRGRDEALSEPRSRTYVNPNSDRTMAEREQVVRDIERDVADLKTKIESTSPPTTGKTDPSTKRCSLHAQEARQPPEGDH